MKWLGLTRLIPSRVKKLCSRTARQSYSEAVVQRGSGTASDERTSDDTSGARSIDRSIDRSSGKSSDGQHRD